MTEEKTLPFVLACDVGNTSLTVARVQGEEVASPQKFRRDDLADLPRVLKKLWAETPDPKVLVAASVNARGLQALEAAASPGRNVLLVGRDLPLPLETNLPDPAQIGADRLCCAAAAYDRLGRACVVADFGTAITIDCVNEQGVFLGGAILPGLRMSLSALHAFTDRLPEVELDDPAWVFGRNTREAMVGGVVYGARGALRERVEAYAAELGVWPIVIATGGDARRICPRPAEDDLVQAVVEDLCLRGIALAYYKTLL